MGGKGPSTFPQNFKKVEKIRTIFMGMTFVGRASFAEIQRGKGTGKPTVTVGENGQISLSSVAAKVITTARIVIGYDADTRKVALYSFTEELGKKYKLTEADSLELKGGTKSSGKFFAGTVFLRGTSFTADTLYNYKASGNQSFDAVVDEKKGVVSFVLPKGTLTPKPKVARTKKVKATEVTNQTPVNAPVEEEELIPA